MLNEAQIIQRLQSNCPNQIGDDAAVLPFSGNTHYVIAKDLLIESIHFNLAYYDVIHLAKKSIQVNLSDIAAMGATPHSVLLGLSIPTHFQHDLTDFLDAFSAECRDAQVELLGGDTTRSPDKLFISVTAIGIVDIKHIKYRSTAHEGDILCVIGHLGHAHVGLHTFEHQIEGFSSFKNDFLNPRARIKEGVWLAQQTGVNAMMDLSDGLYVDLQRLCDASQVAGIIHCEALHPNKAFEAACKQLGLDSLTTQLIGGEDYSLLVSINPDEYERISQSFKAAYNDALTPIGLIENGQGVSIHQDNKPLSMQLSPFSHFGERS